MELLADGLRGSGVVQVIVCGNLIGHDGAKAIGELISTNPDLELLDLSNNLIRGTDIAPVTSAGLLVFRPSIESVKLLSTRSFEGLTSNGTQLETRDAHTCVRCSPRHLLWKR